MRVGEETPGLGSSTKGVLQKCLPSTLTPLGDCVFRDNGLRAVGAQRQRVMDGYGGIHLLLIWMRWKYREALPIWGGEEARCPAPGKRMLNYVYFVPWLSWQEVLPLLWSLWLCGERGISPQEQVRNSLAWFGNSCSLNTSVLNKAVKKKFKKIKTTYLFNLNSQCPSVSLTAWGLNYLHDLSIKSVVACLLCGSAIHYPSKSKAIIISDVCCLFVVEAGGCVPPHLQHSPSMELSSPFCVFRNLFLPSCLLTVCFCCLKYRPILY